MFILEEHKSSHYAPRTYYNAHRADLTIAIAANYLTGGEVVTHKAAKDKYLALPLTTPAIENARLLWRELKRRNVSVLNVAGNGIYTLSKYGYTQAGVNDYAFELLRHVVPHWPITLVVSGGQTGIDTAGAVAAQALGIPAELCYPKGYKVRFEDGIDVSVTKEWLTEWLTKQVEQIKVTRL